MNYLNEDLKSLEKPEILKMLSKIIIKLIEDNSKEEWCLQHTRIYILIYDSLIHLNDNFNYAIYSKKIVNKFLFFLDQIILKNFINVEDFSERTLDIISIFSNSKKYKIDPKSLLLFDMFLVWKLQFLDKIGEQLNLKTDFDIFFKFYLTDRLRLKEKFKHSTIEKKIDLLLKIERKKIPWNDHLYTLSLKLIRLKEEGFFRTNDEAFEFGSFKHTHKNKPISPDQLEKAYSNYKYNNPD